MDLKVFQWLFLQMWGQVNPYPVTLGHIMFMLPSPKELCRLRGSFGRGDVSVALADSTIKAFFQAHGMGASQALRRYLYEERDPRHAMEAVICGVTEEVVIYLNDIHEGFDGWTHDEWDIHGTQILADLKTYISLMLLCMGEAPPGQREIAEARAFERLAEYRASCHTSATSWEDALYG